MCAPIFELPAYINSLTLVVQILPLFDPSRRGWDRTRGGPSASSPSLRPPPAHCYSCLPCNYRTKWTWVEEEYFIVQCYALRRFFHNEPQILNQTLSESVTNPAAMEKELSTYSNWKFDGRELRFRKNRGKEKGEKSVFLGYK